MTQHSSSSFIATFLVLAFGGLLLSGCAGKMGKFGHKHSDVDAKADLVDPEGNDVGKVTFYDSKKSEKVGVSARINGLPAGFHGFHIHENGTCEPNFKAAGGHLNPEGKTHSNHPGDMPVLLINEDQTGKISFNSDRFTIDQLTSGDGTAIIIHQKPDNYTNIPDRYTLDGPDETTLAVGDAGGRLACGVVQSHSKKQK